MIRVLDSAGSTLVEWGRQQQQQQQQVISLINAGSVKVFGTHTMSKTKPYGESPTT